MTLRSRIARLKERSFEEVLSAVFAELGLEFPDRLPAFVLCPIHGERTPSLKISEEFWFCHGNCKRGGDAIDFLSALEGLDLPDAIARLEGILGLSDDPAEAALSRARAERPDLSERESKRWLDLLEELEATLLERLAPYLSSPDPVARGISEGPAEAALEELALARLEGPLLTPRGRRERLRGLRAECRGCSRWVERQVERCTGRDRLDAACLAGTGERRARARILLPLAEDARRGGESVWEALGRAFPRSN